MEAGPLGLRSFPGIRRQTLFSYCCCCNLKFSSLDPFHTYVIKLWMWSQLQPPGKEAWWGVWRRVCICFRLCLQKCLCPKVPSDREQELWDVGEWRQMGLFLLSCPMKPS